MGLRDKVILLDYDNPKEDDNEAKKARGFYINIGPNEIQRSREKILEKDSVQHERQHSEGLKESMKHTNPSKDRSSKVESQQVNNEELIKLVGEGKRASKNPFFFVEFSLDEEHVANNSNVPALSIGFRDKLSLKWGREMMKIKTLIKQSIIKMIEGPIANLSNFEKARGKKLKVISRGDVNTETSCKAMEASKTQP